MSGAAIGTLPAMHALILASGSAGDVHPFVAIGQALSARGHAVDVMANGHFRGVVTAAGLGFIESGTAEEYRAAIENPDLWHPRKGMKLVVGEGVVPALESNVETILRVRRDDTVMIASTLGFPARIVNDVHGVPLATVHLSPSVFKTLHRMPRYSGMPCTERSPRWWKKFMWKMTDWVTDSMLASEVNRLRVGLPPVKSVFMTWLHSPDLCIGLWPEWFGPMQPDWPAQTKLTGFPLFDESEQREVNAELVAFLDAGDPPLVFTAGSANVTAPRFFAEAAATCVRMKRRGLLLTSRRETVPTTLPDGVRWESYAPFSRVLPRAAVLISHGGIGTVAQGLAAGIPQIVAALAFDQFDNASRLEDIGVGKMLPMKRYTAARGAAMLDQLLNDTAVATACARYRDEMKPSIEETVKQIEKL